VPERLPSFALIKQYTPQRDLLRMEQYWPRIHRSKSNVEIRQSLKNKIRKGKLLVSIRRNPFSSKGSTRALCGNTQYQFTLLAVRTTILRCARGPTTVPQAGGYHHAQRSMRMASSKSDGRGTGEYIPRAVFLTVSILVD
jgi:hypothetical protein